MSDGLRKLSQVMQLQITDVPQKQYELPSH